MNWDLVTLEHLHDPLPIYLNDPWRLSWPISRKLQIHWVRLQCDFSIRNGDRPIWSRIASL